MNSRMTFPLKEPGTCGLRAQQQPRAKDHASGSEPLRAQWWERV